MALNFLIVLAFLDRVSENMYYHTNFSIQGVTKLFNGPAFLHKVALSTSSGQFTHKDGLVIAVWDRLKLFIDSI